MQFDKGNWLIVLEFGLLLGLGGYAAYNSKTAEIEISLTLVCLQIRVLYAVPEAIATWIHGEQGYSR